MKKINNSNARGSSFLDKFFPNWDLEDEEIQLEKERVVAATAASEHIDNKTADTEADSSASSTNGEGRTVNIGSINIGGDVHVHMDVDHSRRDSWSRRSSDDDDVIDVDYVDVTDRTTSSKAPTQRLIQSSQHLSKQELTKFIRMGDFDALKELDQLIQSGDKKKLTELFKDNRPLCFWIKRTTQQHRWDKLPVSIQNIVNQQIK